MPDARTLKLTAIAALLHLLLLVAIQYGLARRVVAPDVAQALIAELFSTDPEPRPAAREPIRPRETSRPQPVMQPAPSPRPAPLETPPAEPGVESVRQAVDASHPATADAARAPASAAPLAQPSPSNRPAAAEASAPAPVAASGPRVVQLGEIQCSTPEPKYPLVSRRVGEQGTARVRLLIDEAGATERAELVGSSGFDRLDRVALEAAQATRCRPYLADGRPIRVTAVRPFAFRLD